MFSRRHWPWLACAAVAAAGFVPALARGEAASSTTASIVAYDTGFRDGSQSDPADSTVEIAAGDTVSFSYPTGSLQHNVVFSSAQPASCTQTTGAVVLPAPPLPAIALPAGWSGTCRFDAAGTYDFVCFVHPEMKGKVVVTASATPTPTGTATPTPTATSSPTPTATPASTPEPPPVRIEAHDFFYQDASQASPDDHSVTVEPGGQVGFSYPAGTSAHNVEFKAAQPTSCTQTAGAMLGDTPPLPKFPLPQGWSGTCRFDTPGTYTFVCSVHPEMTGTVVVPGAAPPATVSAVTRDSDPAPVPKPWATLDAPSRAAATLAAFLGRKLRMGAHCASVSSGTLVLSVSKAVARRLKLKRTTIASAHARCLGNNRFTVTVKPTAAARKALRHYRKALKVTATLKLGKLRDRRTITLKGQD